MLRTRKETLDEFEKHRLEESCAVKVIDAKVSDTEVRGSGITADRLTGEGVDCRWWRRDRIG